MAERPHLDIFVNGDFANCATSEEEFIRGTPLPVLGIGNTGGGDLLIDNDITTDTRFDGAVDEVRFWTVARTQDQIQACMDTELSFEGGGECAIDSSRLIGYWRLSEGEGSNVFDFTGNGNRGFLEIPSADEAWEDGWIGGAPIAKD
jgi:hypothetical protein